MDSRHWTGSDDRRGLDAIPHDTKMGRWPVRSNAELIAELDELIARCQRLLEVDASRTDIHPSASTVVGGGAERHRGASTCTDAAALARRYAKQVAG